MSDVLRRSKKYHLEKEDIEIFTKLLEEEIGVEAVKQMSEEDIISAACFFLSLTMAAYHIEERKQRQLLA